ncbi:hypothetical protein BDQ12DRAFT_630610 [Crucibulum laeve]|uniref:WDR59/RTC1-like RING zinc finger domain-containing protein n=1 Tax=Crucibulum laeve TaxID=68775 RepID=A0A5C3M215_9AGAR|nr:hypothetical protein BDQ12DRAFT_630610 [Crucibulum laeve]
MCSSSSSQSSEERRAAGEYREDPIFIPPESYFSNNRTLWAPGFVERSEEEVQDERMPRSQSRSRRARHINENLSFSPLERSVLPTTSLLTARRPSTSLGAVPDSIDRSRKRRRQVHADSNASELHVEDIPEAFVEPGSPEDEGNFRRSLQIDMKTLVGDAVGNMSISPASRDVVLAARRGLFIIDLESPFEVPRFLPQGGTWDVADVQWNPHPSRAEYIVSTSSEKMLIWNLLLVGKTSIEHILKSHYRAITDINWHTTECDTVASTGIDSWVWAWDLREPRKPIFGLSAFKSPGTQVKWNRQDANILASSHGNEVLIWDRRKGSLPITKIRAHNSKIYGIDWSHQLRDEIVTCSLDKTIKTWDINELAEYEGGHEPKSVIRTTYPVWRARNLPFGQGVMSLAQRGETALEMYAKNDTGTPVDIFEGHTDVVKEFVWRKGGQDEFQLITWSKDRTLRFWPVETETMQKVGYNPEIARGRQQRKENDKSISFRSPPEGTEDLPALSAPVGHRSILAEVRAGPPPRQSTTTNPIMQPHLGSSSRASHENLDATPTQTNRAIAIVPAARLQGETMSRGGFGGKSVARMDALTWLSNVKVGSRRGSSSGAGSGPDSTGASRLSSRSRAREGVEGPGSEGGKRKRSDSQSRATDDRRDGEGGQSLQDEITSVLTKLASSKIKLEKHDLSKKRTCTLGLHGPWGESSSVFIRVTFTFPREYPQGIHPDGTPTVELERNPLISMKDRAYMLKRLKAIRERKRPCLEACLRFLLFADEEEQSQRPTLLDSESSGDEDDPTTRKSRDLTVAALLRTHKNLAEPRTSQGSFGPNGELVCFFRAPPRIVRNVLRGLSDSPAQPSEEPQPQPTEPQQRRLFQSPALVSDAVRRLGLAATDRTLKSVDPRRPEGTNILRIMTNLLTISQHKMRRDSESKPLGDIPKSYALLPTRRSTVFMMNTTNIAGGDRKVAVDYIFQSTSLADVCEKNAAFAREHGRYDHERAFKSLQSLFRIPDYPLNVAGGEPASFASDSLAVEVITQLYIYFGKMKDIQMLAMLSMLILQTTHGSIIRPRMTRIHSDTTIPLLTPIPKLGAMDYFSLAMSINNLSSPTSPLWPRLSSPIAPMAQSISSSNSSRGSWSSLFNTGSMRQFMHGVQDTLKDGLTTPSTEVPLFIPSGEPTPLPRAERNVNRTTESPGPRRRPRKDSSLYSSSVISKSWNDPPQRPSATSSLSFSSAGHKRPGNLRSADSNPFIFEKAVIFEPASPPESHPLFDSQLLKQFVAHVYIYAELLFQWELYHKRLELLKSVNGQEATRDKTEPHSIGLMRICKQPGCNSVISQKADACPECHHPAYKANCTICRLPVKGLSRSCLSCYHVTHISCWNALDVPICPTGCGCFCSGFEGTYTRPSTRLGTSPPLNSLMLSSGIS